MSPWLLSKPRPLRPAHLLRFSILSVNRRHKLWRVGASAPNGRRIVRGYHSRTSGHGALVNHSPFSVPRSQKRAQLIGAPSPIRCSLAFAVDWRTGVGFVGFAATALASMRRRKSLRSARNCSEDGLERCRAARPAGAVARPEREADPAVAGMLGMLGARFISCSVTPPGATGGADWGRWLPKLGGHGGLGALAGTPHASSRWTTAASARASSATPRSNAHVIGDAVRANVPQ